MEELEALDRVVASLAAAQRFVDVERAARDEAMRSALAAGWSIGNLAERARLTPARVGQILGYPYGRRGRPPSATPAGQ